MKKFLVFLLELVLILILVAGVGVGIYYLVNWQGWPLWSGAAIFAGVLGLAVGAYFFKRWRFRVKERAFVKHVVETDVPGAAVQERRVLRDLEDRFAAAAELLATSQLAKRGNPVYVFPWYLALGEPGSGKTTALRRARIGAILTDIGPERDTVPTKNCDFWFAEGAVILDTAGRYAVPSEAAQDKEEWERFLALLAKYRIKEPLNGLFAVIGADRLAASTDEDLAEYGKGLRRRINELMRVVGARFPVYVLVTKMDKVLGFTGFSRMVPDEGPQQAMGVSLDPNDRRAPEEILAEAVAIISGRAADLRLLLPRTKEPPDPSYLVFPVELEALTPKLTAFVATLFDENPYLETPLFRGLYFSGAGEDPAPQSLLSKELAAVAAQTSPAAEATGGFLRDFFDKILPADRNLFSPILEFIRWRSRTRLSGAAAWLSIGLFVCGLLSLSYFNNVRALKSITAEFPSLPALSGSYEDKLITLDQFRRKVVEMERVNRDWWAPRMGLSQSDVGEEMVKASFCAMFASSILTPMDASMRQGMDALDAKTPEAALGLYIGHLVWRIELLSARLKGQKVDQLKKIPAYPETALRQIDPKLVPEMAPYFNDMYIDYLCWTTSKESLERSLGDYRSRLTRLASVKGGSMLWLIDWANSRAMLAPVGLPDFWGGYASGQAAETVIQPAFTSKGKQAIEAFVKQFDESVDNPKEFKSRLDAFWVNYAKLYANSWKNFAERFHDGVGLLIDDNDWRKMAARMPTLQNPYFVFITRMAVELDALGKIAPKTDFGVQADSFKWIVDHQQDKLKSENLLQKEKEKAQAALSKVVGEVSSKEALKFQSLIEASGQLDAYRKALSDMVPTVASQEAAFQFVSSSLAAPAPAAPAAGQPPQAGKSLIQTANTALLQMNALLGVHESADGTVAALTSGPIAFFVFYTTQLASCELERLWESEVLSETVSLPQAKLHKTLFDKQNGLVWKFVNGSAKPFVSRELKGWTARSWFNQPFPVHRSFLSFLDSGSTETQEALPEYQVTLRTVPTSVNPDARQQPFLTTLTLACGDKTQELKNYNFLDSQQFKWKPDGCGDTTLSVSFADVVATKVYPGPTGFALFLRDFKNGGLKVFASEDFPQQKAYLDGLGVKKVTVSYQIDGGAPVVKLLDAAPTQIPQTIADCVK